MARVIYTDRKEKITFPPRTCRKGLYDEDASFNIAYSQAVSQWSKHTGSEHGAVWRVCVTSSSSFAPQKGTTWDVLWWLRVTGQIPPAPGRRDGTSGPCLPPCHVDHV